MNYVISIIAPTAEEKLVGICAELEIPRSFSAGAERLSRACSSCSG